MQKMASFCIRIAINDKSQGSVAKHLSCDGLLYYTFIIHSAGKRFLRLVNIWRSYRQNGDCFMRPFAFTFVLQHADFAR